MDLTKTELGPTIGRAPKRQTRSVKLFVRRSRHGPCLANPHRREGSHEGPAIADFQAIV